MRFGPLIDQLIEAFQCLPGVGPKSAQRMTLHLLERDRAGGEFLAQSLERALARVGRCTRCRNWKRVASVRFPGCRYQSGWCWSRCCGIATAGA